VRNTVSVAVARSIVAFSCPSKKSLIVLDDFALWPLYCLRLLYCIGWVDIVIGTKVKRISVVSDKMHLKIKIFDSSQRAPYIGPVGAAKTHFNES
jgi:hypothetical protein